jgi:hypothetical protein
MIISYKYKYIFVGIPYSASSAISKELIEKYEGEFILNKHSNIPYLLSNVKINIEDYTVVGVYRDPLDILFSRYNKLKNNPDSRYTDPSFAAINGGYVTAKAITLSHKIRIDKISFPEYLKFTSKKKGVILPYNNEFTINKKYFNFILNFENLDHDFQNFLNKINVEKSGELNKLNKTKKELAESNLDKDFLKKYLSPFYHFNSKNVNIRKTDFPAPTLFYKILFRVLIPLKRRALFKRENDISVMMTSEDIELKRKGNS